MSEGSEHGRGPTRAPVKLEGPRAGGEYDALDGDAWPTGIPCYAADEVALTALARRRALAEAPTRCDACDEAIEGRSPAMGAHLSSRDGTTSVHDVPLCDQCATAIGITALRRFELEEG